MAHFFRCVSALTLWATLSLGCAQEQQDAPEPVAPTQRVDIEKWGLSFNLPRHWIPRRQGGAFVYSGPSQNDSFYTTVTVQGIASHGDRLDSILDTAYGPLSEQPHFAWNSRNQIQHEGAEAILYEVEFERHEVPRKRRGLLLDMTTHVVDVAYAAPALLFDSEVEVFRTLQESLRLSPKQGL